MFTDSERQEEPAAQVAKMQTYGSLASLDGDTAGYENDGAELDAKESSPLSGGGTGSGSSPTLEGGRTSMSISEPGASDSVADAVMGVDRSATFGGFPKTVYYIIGNEFCERFCYYGFKTILVLYLVNYLSMDPDDATTLNHVFVMLAYFFPLLGMCPPFVFFL